ncbi:unnamed protein product, partial [Prorocentrum cordatum]
VTLTATRGPWKGTPAETTGVLGELRVKSPRPRQQSGGSSTRHVDDNDAAAADEDDDVDDDADNDDDANDGELRQPADNFTYEPSGGGAAARGGSGTIFTTTAERIRIPSRGLDSGARSPRMRGEDEEEEEEEEERRRLTEQGGPLPVGRGFPRVAVQGLGRERRRPRPQAPATPARGRGPARRPARPRGLRGPRRPPRWRGTGRPDLTLHSTCGAGRGLRAPRPRRPPRWRGRGRPAPAPSTHRRQAAFLQAAAHQQRPCGLAGVQARPQTRRRRADARGLVREQQGQILGHEGGCRRRRAGAPAAAGAELRGLLR